jgi:hypothetical protein
MYARDAGARSNRVRGVQELSALASRFPTPKRTRSRSTSGFLGTIASRQRRLTFACRTARANYQSEQLLGMQFSATYGG